MTEGAVPWPQEIRLAMTMVGGASLAVWMGGVATEVSALLHASRTPDAEGGYRKLLDLLHATVCLDVLTGTSAGGINAACLGLAEAYRTTPEVLRDTWLHTGSMDNLIRDPGERQPRSLLDGDRVLLGGLERALHRITDGRPMPVGDPDITVLLTGTMVDGETTRYDDALGNMIRDSEHRMLFRFDGPQWKQQVHGPLALAARSTASFPGAFELSRLPIGKTGTDPLHPDMTEYTELTRSHWLTDGGVLVNKPLRPALQEIFERPSSADVRRLLLYVVPTTEVETTALPCDPANPPLLGAALAKVVSTVMNQTISSELDELTRHNDSVSRARDTRVSLAALGLQGSDLVDPRMMAAYLDRRVADDAAELVRSAVRRYALSDMDSADAGTAEWASGMSEGLREIAATGLKDGMAVDPPPASCTVEQLAAYRSTALDDAVATGLQLVNAGFRLGPDAARAAQLNEARAELHKARQTAARGMRLSAWVAHHEPPAQGTSLTAWIGGLAREWAKMGATEALLRAWPMVTAALRAAAPPLRSLATDPANDAAEIVTTLLRWFGLAGSEAAEGAAASESAELPAPASVDDGLLRSRLLRLHMATRGLLAQPPSVDQRVDLVQVSADTRTLLDLGRRRSRDKLTGMQADYFGAFYKSSWRASDWMWGRVDGAGWLTQCLLDPKRLKALRDIVGAEAFRGQVRDTFNAIGWRPPDAADNGPADELSSLLAQLGAELAFLGLDAQLGDVAFGDRLPASLPVTSMVLARARQSQIARAELPEVGKQAEADAVEGNGKPSENFRAVAASVFTDQNSADDDVTQRVFQACQVSAERFEQERGSTLLTKTLVKAGAAGLNAAAGATRVPSSLQPAAKFAQLTGRSAWWVTLGATRLGRPWNLLAGVVTMLAGLVLGGNGGVVLQWVGLPLAAGALVFLVVSLLSLRRTWRMVLTLLGVLVTAALLFAAFLPPIAHPLFGWLGDVVAGWRRGEAPVWWLAVVLLLLLPALWSPIAAWRRRRR
ncbi:patatin-like protein [Amycolatopsis saalfeldensis]|uniref:Patatin-related protein n=1 Tax=Amycolatopsis saalfeldensis TaxID=394193 RepID=A0A1H8WGV3_9PSEU|nr:patatin-like protein [Amycolatopsis saalfeldensis]SEP26348.1 patatin-related protein [Amycolatopsis saalfeldensis]